MRRALLAVAAIALAASAASAHDLPASPLTQDPLGPLLDVTTAWTAYQPADAFCVRPDGVQLLPAGPLVDGGDPACALSGFDPDETGLVKIEVVAPPLCNGCRRLFLDYSRIPPENDPPVLYAHGHVYFHLGSLNPGYTIDPIAHSPNVKNFTNDKLFVPDESPQAPLVHAFDTHNRAYTGNTLHTIHNDAQGPYYTGPRYLSRDGIWIHGAYLDVTVVGDTGRLEGDHRLNEIDYFAAFHSGEPTCPDEAVAGGQVADGDAFYGGCVDGFGAGRAVVDPFA